MRSVSRVIPAVIAGAVGMVAGLGIGLVAASHGSTGTPRGPATTSIASSAQRAREGTQLGRDSGRNWAYESIPIYVKGNGRYFFDLARSQPVSTTPPTRVALRLTGLKMRASALWGPLHRIMWPCGPNGTSRWVSPCAIFPAQDGRSDRVWSLTVVIGPGSTEQAP